MKKSVIVNVLAVLILLSVVDGAHDISQLPPPPAVESMNLGPVELPNEPCAPGAVCPAPVPPQPQPPSGRSSGGGSRGGGGGGGRSRTQIFLPSTNITNTSIIFARLDAIEADIDYLITVETRLADLKIQLDSFLARIDSIDSRLNTVQNDIASIKEGSAAAIPGVFDQLMKKLKSNTILSVSLSILALLLVAGLIVYMEVAKKKSSLENKRLVIQYLKNYQKAGYRIEALEMNLRASGWSDELIREAEKELQSNVYKAK